VLDSFVRLSVSYY